MLTGERPEVNPEVRGAAARVRPRGLHRRTSCGRASGRSSGACCRTPTSACSRREDLARLREVTASQGLMLESVSERLMETVHAGSPTKHPARRLETIRAGGRAEDPVHERDPGRDRRERGGAHRVAGGARGAARRARPHPGGDPAELRAAPALLRPGAGADRRRGRARVLAHGRGGLAAGAAAAGVGVRGHHRGHEAADRRDAAADAGRRDPGPAEPVGLVGRARGAPARPTWAA